jgi:GNAT superfamily N-acetyltransferase
MFYESENRSIILACKKAEKELNRSIVSFEDTKRVNISAWWDKDPEYDYCVDTHSGNIILEHLNEDFEGGIKESIGEFSCYYFYRYDPQGDYLDVLDNADAISGDLCLAIGTLMNSKNWEDVYNYSSGVLYIERFYIKPEYRGKKIGYLIFPVLVDVFSKRKDTVVTIIPEPLNDMVQDLSREETTLKSTLEYQLALTKMQVFIKKIGFEQLGNGEVWAAAVMDKGILT